MKFNDVVTEGTWAIRSKQIPELIADLEQLKTKAYHIAGDDELFDHLDGALDRLKRLMA